MIKAFSVWFVNHVCCKGCWIERDECRCSILCQTPSSFSIGKVLYRAKNGCSRDVQAWKLQEGNTGENTKRLSKQCESIWIIEDFEIILLRMHFSKVWEQSSAIRCFHWPYFFILTIIQSLIYGASYIRLHWTFTKLWSLS